MIKKNKTVKINSEPPKCWIAQHHDKSKNKLSGIWAKIPFKTRTRINKECSITIKEEKSRLKDIKRR